MYDQEINFPIYEDTDDECKSQNGCSNQLLEYDYDYEEMSSESLQEIYENCVIPSVYGTAKYLTPLFVVCLFFKLFTRIVKVPHKLFHLLSLALGICILNYYVPESQYLMTTYAVLSYACLCIPRRYQRGIEMFLISLSVILYCEYSMDPVAWHKIRSVVMIAAMKAVSVSLNSISDLPDIWEYAGYLFNPATCLFGPWISLTDYLSTEHDYKPWTPWHILGALQYLMLSLIFLSVSNCWTNWIINDFSGRWLLAYRDALSFRASHYFISFVASTTLLLGEFPSSLATITRPTDMELPRSLVQVVVSWNIPMHTWLKLYVFRPSVRHLGKFGAVIATYLTSSLLHGLNFQLAAVLLSLGLYTYVEFQLRNVVANVFDACVAAKKCPPDKCRHSKNSRNFWVILTNFGFCTLSVFHLAYLGLMFDTSEHQETGYNYLHTISKWSHLDFASHWVAVTTYLVYYLIK